MSLLPSVLFPDTPESFVSDLLLEPEDSDEALALQLQEELDREAAQATDLVDGGLLFCHICYRDLTRMTAEGRTQHVNRWGAFIGFIL